MSDQMRKPWGTEATAGGDGSDESPFVPVIAAGADRQTTAIVFLRPDDTTEYAAGDALADSTTEPEPLVFAGMARMNGGTGAITKAMLQTDAPAFDAGLRLHLWNAPPTATNDNEALALATADAEHYQGYVDFGDPVIAGSELAIAANVAIGGSGLSFACAEDDDSLYGLIEVLDVFTPDAEQEFVVSLTAVRD